MFKKLCPFESTHTLGRERTERYESKGLGQGKVTGVYWPFQAKVHGVWGWKGPHRSLSTMIPLQNS